MQDKLFLAIIDTKSGDQVLFEEYYVRKFMENLLNSPEEYVMTAFERCLTKDQRKRTKLLTHSYYVIHHPTFTDYHTLSFSGTTFAFYSIGAWAMDSDLDVNSYRSYTTGKNRWDVREIATDGVIDTEKTIKKIITKMDEGVHYYFRDHLENKPGMDNCNTALWETLMFR